MEIRQVRENPIWLGKNNYKISQAPLIGTEMVFVNGTLLEPDEYEINGAFLTLHQNDDGVKLTIVYLVDTKMRVMVDFSPK